jgi:signal transduction histidine kinase
MIVLLVRRGGKEIARYPVRREPILIGRGKTAKLRIADPLLSKEHARITPGPNGVLLLRDLGSRNGTIVNKRRLGAEDGSVRLVAGHTVRVGETSITIAEESENDVDAAESTLAMERDPPPPDAAERAAADTLHLRLDSIDAKWAAARAPEEEVLALLWHAGWALNRISDRGEILESLRALLERGLPQARVFVLEPSGAAEWTPTTGNGSAAPSMTVVRQAVETRSAVLVRDARNDERLSTAVSVHLGRIRSAIAAPLLIRETAVAVLYADRREWAPFTEQELRLVGIVANHAAAALENAAHLSELTRAKEELATLNRELERRVEQRTAEVQRQADEIALLAAEKDDLLGMAAHDIRNPLTAVLGLLEMADAEGAAWGKRRSSDSMLPLATEGVERVLGLVTDLLDLQKVEAGKIALERRRHAARAFLEDSIRFTAPLARKKGLLLSIEADAALEVEIDAARLAQVVQNLVANAIKFTPEGGRVTVSARADGAALEVAVADTGSGISAAELPALFGRFEQGAVGRGTRGSYGLGLAIAKKLVELHGGRIWAESEEGKGSTFRLSIPDAAPARPGPA